MGLMELGCELFAFAIAQGLFNQIAGFTAGFTSETFGLYGALSLGANSDLYGLQAAPPTWMVSLIEPSASDCSLTECPCLRASSLAFSTA